MYFQTLIVAALTLAAPSLAQAELKVVVYEGPTECEDAEKVMKGNYLQMHYTGKIDESSETGEKGKEFDSSREGGTFDFQVGVGQVIRGWDEGLLGLCKGAKATLVIPPEIGYGEQGAGDVIPGGATMNFNVEVVNVSDEAPEGGGPGNPGGLNDIFKEIDTNGDEKLDKDEIEAFFQGMGRETPDKVWNDDKDKDGYISWDEFSAPKVSAPKEDPKGEEL